MSKRFRWLVAIMVGLFVACVTASAIALGYPLAYHRRIYPGVHVQDVDVGGLTVEEAQCRLKERLPDPTTQVVELHAGERSWRLSWTDLGRGYDYADTAKRAHQVGREGPYWQAGGLSAWRLRLRGYSIEPGVIPPDPGRVRDALENIASLVAEPPTNAQLHVGSGEVVSVPAQSGKALDVETSASRVLWALEDGAAEVELAVVDVAPRLSEPEPAYTLAQAILAQPFTLVADDPLTDYRAEFAAPPERVAAWLRPNPEYTSDDARMVLKVNEEAVQTWLYDVEAQLGEERLLNVAEALTRTETALAAGEHRIQPPIYHPESTYIVQPGDVFFDIAYDHGFPQWRLEEANPDVDPESLAVGMELVIPSIDALFPEPLVPGKRIEISLPEQRLRAYEGDELVYDFTCSSGMTSTPTIAGQFQVLFKEPKAYAPRWDLEMPYFMAVYYEGPDFANGIHELPIMSSGRRLWAGALGWPASYGCIILDVGDAGRLYEWAPVGTLVRIKGVAPGTPTYEERMEQIKKEEP